MRKRTNLAISLIGLPKVLIMDNPTDGLDLVSKRHLWDCLARFQTNRSILVMTHDVDEDSLLLKKIALTSRGEISFIGAQKDLRKKIHDYPYRMDVYFNDQDQQAVVTYITELIGADNMNIIQQGLDRMSVGLKNNVTVSELWIKLETSEKIKEIVKRWSIERVKTASVVSDIASDDEEVLKKKISDNILHRSTKLFIKK
jgi:ABC-type multidrug transport system ATPase subunit